MTKPKTQYDERIVPFTAGDGMELNLVNVRGEKPPAREPVLLVHGAGVRANIYRAPVEVDIVDTLIENGFDVWLENWRSSIEFPKNTWTLDQAAVYDHPQAVKTVVDETGREKIKAIIHCQGSTSFTMSAMAGLVPQVDTIVTNAVSLHTVVPRWSGFKLRFLVPGVNLITRYFNPHWGVKSPTLFAKFMNLMVRMTHHECDNNVCRLVSFTYGSGFPALWLHENLNDESHEWLKEEFGNVPLRFFKQMNRCVRKGNLVSVEDLPELPKDFAAGEPQTDARFVFFAGNKNLCFLPESQRRSYEFFNKHRKNYHTLHELDDYSHLDIFMGKRAAQDVFPRMVEELSA